MATARQKLAERATPGVLTSVTFRLIFRYDLTVPDLTVSDLTVPDLTVPNLTVPDLTVPV